MQLSGVSKDFGNKVLFTDVNWLVTPEDRIGLVGANGTGKTTLLRMLAGLETPDHGQIVRPRGATVGYLPQDGLALAGRSVFDECLSVFQDVLDLETEQRDLSAKLATLPPDSAEYRAAADRYAEVHHRFDVAGGYALEARVGTVLHGLGFSRGDWPRPCETFSGGWQMRIALAKLLLARPNLLLLDEPTNHLDLEARNWLEEHLAAYAYAFVIVSHDRYFLDVTVRKVVQLWNKRLHFYPGNYSAYVRGREQRHLQLEAEHRNQQVQIRHLETFINRFRYQATKASQVQSRINTLSRMERIEIPQDEKTISFRFPQPPASGRMVVECKDAARSYGELKVFSGVNFTIERGDRVALVGVNGAGKSTLIRLLAGLDAPTSGEVRVGHNVQREYFAQDQYRALDPERRLLDDLGSLAPAATQTWLRTLLGCFLFRDDEVFKPIGVLSGGERNRYAMARLLLAPSNFLLLDEPTNHLDLRAKDVLLDALRDFSGTMVFVSHDRHFIDGLATKVFEVVDGGVNLYAGNYEDYLRQRAGPVEPAAPAEQAAAVTPPAPPSELTSQRGALVMAPEAVAGSPRRLNPIQREKMRRRAAEMEDEIARLESEIADLQAALERAAAYPQTQEIVQRLESRNAELEALFAEWGELQTAINPA